MFYKRNTDGEIQSVDPKQISAVIDAVNPAVVSIRTCDGDEITIGDIAIEIRPNGVHILLECPEACMTEAE